MLFVLLVSNFIFTPKCLVKAVQGDPILLHHTVPDEPIEDGLEDPALTSQLPYTGSITTGSLFFYELNWNPTFFGMKFPKIEIL